MAEKKVLINICRAPFGTVFYTEGLRAGVGVSAGIDENIPTILFQSDGVFYCLKDVDKSALVESIPGTIPDVPLLCACPANLECRVIEECTVEHRHVFIAEVVEAHVDERFVTDVEGRPRIAPLQDLDPILYALDNTYYSVGRPIGTGYREAERFPGRRQ